MPALASSQGRQGRDGRASSYQACVYNAGAIDLAALVGGARSRQVRKGLKDITQFGAYRLRLCACAAAAALSVLLECRGPLSRMVLARAVP
eukprot:2588590-Alexandrium_andersonii.AAC.1